MGDRIVIMQDIILRAATLDDLDFLVEVDREDEGVTSAFSYDTPQEVAKHRAKIAGFVDHDDAGAWVLEDRANGRLAGCILCRFRDRSTEEPNDWNQMLFRTVGDDWLRPEQRFCEVFQLWVDPGYRRQGLAMRLKRHMEVEARARGIRVLYTHTEEVNLHVIELNRKLGYHEVRRGPIWDDVVRVSMFKRLG